MARAVNQLYIRLKIDLIIKKRVHIYVLFFLFNNLTTTDMSRQAGLMQALMRGKLAEHVYMRRNSEQVVRKYVPHPNNPQTESQLLNRIPLINRQKNYKRISQYTSSFFTLNKKGQSSANRFIQINKKIGEIYLMKEDAAKNFFLYQNYIVSEGVLKPLNSGVAKSDRDREDGYWWLPIFDTPRTGTTIEDLRKFFTMKAGGTYKNICVHFIQFHTAPGNTSVLSTEWRIDDDELPDDWVIDDGGNIRVYGDEYLTFHSVAVFILTANDNYRHLFSSTQSLSLTKIEHERITQYEDNNPIDEVLDSYRKQVIPKL